MPSSGSFAPAVAGMVVEVVDELEVVLVVELVVLVVELVVLELVVLDELLVV